MNYLDGRQVLKPAKVSNFFREIEKSAILFWIIFDLIKFSGNFWKIDLFFLQKIRTKKIAKFNLMKKITIDISK
jgi:hypothetical protein